MSFVLKPLTALGTKLVGKLLAKFKKKDAAADEDADADADAETEKEKGTKITEESGWGHESTIESLRKEINADQWVTSEEYLELIVQYGYMTMFATLYPMAPTMILLNNLLEYQLDVRELLKSQRPIYIEREGLGPWRSCLIFVSAFATLVNCGILWIELENDASLRHQATELWKFTGGEVFMPLDFEHSNAGRMALAVIIEHFILITRWAIDQIGDVPTWVEEQDALNTTLAQQVTLTYILPRPPTMAYHINTL